MMEVVTTAGEQVLIWLAALPLRISCYTGFCDYCEYMHMLDGILSPMLT